eukprot:8654999-Prorocentrum_lima.AAC.1
MPVGIQQATCDCGAGAWLGGAECALPAETVGGSSSIGDGKERYTYTAQTVLGEMSQSVHGCGHGYTHVWGSGRYACRGRCFCMAMYLSLIHI